MYPDDNIIIHEPQRGGTEMTFGSWRLVLADPAEDRPTAPVEVVRRAMLDWPAFDPVKAFGRPGSYGVKVHVLGNSFSLKGSGTMTFALHTSGTIVIGASPFRDRAGDEYWGYLVGHELCHYFNDTWLRGPSGTNFRAMLISPTTPIGELAPENIRDLLGGPLVSAYKTGMAIDPDYPETRARAKAYLLQAIHEVGLERGEGTMLIALKVGSSVATVDGRPVTLDTAPIIDRNGRTLVPVRFVAEALGCKVSWDNATRTVTIQK